MYIHSVTQSILELEMRILNISVLCFATALLAGCSSTVKTKATVPYAGSGLPVTMNLPVKKMTPLTLKQIDQNYPCSINEFVAKYLGKNLVINKEKIRIDQIIPTNIFQQELINEEKFLFWSRISTYYDCSYTGYGLELDFGNIKLLSKNDSYDDDEDDEE